MTELNWQQRVTLEALADTVVPGCKRNADDIAIAGVDSSPGAVQAGALAVLTHPATGMADGVAGMADMLNELAAGPSRHESGVPPFVALDYAARRALLGKLCRPDNPSRELWFLVLLFAYMAFDSAPHLDTASAVRGGHVGLVALGIRQPDSDGLWRNEQKGYGTPTACPRAGTDAKGNLP